MLQSHEDNEDNSKWVGERKDKIDMKCLKNESGEVLVEAYAVKER